ncbi:MAG: RagB/SusD family nutrient uptake outer membrane protein [Bacteroidales bacterium]|nr:RagB/SusD family nutrient uptake outer membrane protein [Bacteroidales bacterium]
MKIIDKKTGLLLLAAAGMLTACDLDSMSMNEADTSNFPKTEEDANQVIAAIYQNNNAVNAYPQESFLYASILASDDALGGGGANDKLMQAYDFITNYGTDATQHFYLYRYEGISRANTLINTIDALELDDEIKKQIKGEALFLRAFYYYELASMYGTGIPMVTKDDGTVEYTNAEGFWGQIFLDLNNAISLMPAKKKNDGHVDKYCAEALLTRAWLFYTGFYCNGEKLADLTSSTYDPNKITSVNLPDGSTMTKDMVKQHIDDCYNNSGYKLVDKFYNLWAYSNSVTNWDSGDLLKTDESEEIKFNWAENDKEVNPESMFATKFNKLADWSTTIGYANGYALHFGIRGGQEYGNTYPWGQGWGAGPVNPTIVSDWENAEPKDSRRKQSIINVSDMPSYTKGGASWKDFIQETEFYQMKLGPISAKKDNGEYVCTFENIMYGADGWVLGANNMQLNNIHDLVHIRFADVCLMWSEMHENADGMNKVRERAGLPNVAYSLKAIQNERRWELFYEGQRWNDIRRWHIAAEVLAKQKGVKILNAGQAGENQEHNGGYAQRYNETAGFFKIPETQISLNEGKVQQNAGYTDANSEYTGY